MSSGAAPPAHRPRRLIRGRRNKLLLASGAIAVLLVGAVLAPRDPPPRRPREAVAPILEEQVERREPARIFRGVQEAGRRVVHFAVAFHTDRRADRYRTDADFGGELEVGPLPTGFGLAVSQHGEVLTHRTALGPEARARAVTGLGEAAIASITVYDPETGLVLLQLAGATPPVPPFAAQPPEPGELVLAAATARGREVVAPRFIGSRDVDTYVLTTPSFRPGTPVFNLAGEALAVAVGPDSPLAYPIADALDRLRRLMEQGRPLPSTLGLRLQQPDARLAERLGAGLVVADVAAGGPAERSGIVPGDVLVRIDGAPLATLADARVRIAQLAARPVQVAFRRGKQERELTLEPDRTLDPPQGSQSPLPPPEAPRAASLFPAQALAEAEVPPTAYVLAVEGRAPTSVRRGALRQGPLLVRLQHEGNRFFAVIGSAPGA